MEVTSTFISTTRSSKFLTLTSYSPVILPASTLRSIRRDFLGCCHTLRPSPHLRTRAGKRKFGRSSTRSPRLVVRASIDSGLVLVVVAVTAFSAIAFAYCHNTFRKRKSSDKVAASPATINGKVSTDQNRRESQHLDGDVHEGSPVEINGGFRKMEEEESHQIQETHVKEYDSFLANQTDMAAEDSQFVVASVSTVAKEHTLVDESLPSSIVNGSVALESATLGVKTPEIQVENIEDQKGMEHDFSQAVVGVHSIASPQVVDDTRALEYEYNGLLQKPIEYSIFTENQREEIHTFYGSNHASAKSSRLTSLKAVSPTVTSATNSLLLDHKNNGIIDTQFPGHSSGQATGNVQEEQLVANGNGGLSHKTKDVRGDWRFPDDGKHVGHQTDESMPQFPDQNFELRNSNGRSPETNDAYYRLLRDGR